MTSVTIIEANVPKVGLAFASIINPLTVIDEYIRQSNIYGETKTIL